MTRREYYAEDDIYYVDMIALLALVLFYFVIKFIVGMSMDPYKVLGKRDSIVEEPTVCCAAMTAECLACSQGISKTDYCLKNPDTTGCSSVMSK